MRTALPLISAGAILFSAAGAGSAAPLDEATPADSAEIVLNDGRVQRSIVTSKPGVLGFSVVDTGSESGGYAYAYHPEKKQLPWPDGWAAGSALSPHPV
ncbi:hypothetical protein [Streptomyces sp. NBC_01216]|uniref:hypothetical protein n=1 Tax=unclassified Streptomyces TaxID=2593676 RepID=UPI002E139EF7|nr:hypothetical protein OG393_14985 [Streptomyces sp. NBC_01216]